MMDDEFDGNLDPAEVAFNRLWKRVRIFLAATVLLLVGVGSAWGSLTYQVSNLCDVVKLHVASQGHPGVLASVEGIRVTLDEAERRLNTHLDQGLLEGKEIAALGASFKVFSSSTTERLIRIEDALDRDRRVDSRRVPAMTLKATLTKVGR